MTSATHPISGSVARKVSALGSAGLAVSLVLICAVAAVFTAKQTRQHTLEWVSDKTTSVADTIDAFDTTSRVLVDKSFRTFSGEFGQVFELSPDGDDLINSDTRLKGNFNAVDHFASVTGGVATVFMRKGNDFQRITTSLKKENGERAMGTMLGDTHPAHALMLAGKPYTGRAVLFGKPYMTYYEPIVTSGQVVGILFIGYDTSAFEASIDSVAGAARFFQTGGLVVIDPRKGPQEAVFLSHPTARGRKVAEVHAGGAEWMQALEQAPQGVLTDAPPLAGGDAGSQWAVLRKAKSNQLWVVAQVPAAEAMAEFWRGLYVLWAVLVLATLGLATGIYLMMRNWVGQPLLRLREAVQAVAQGDLSRGFHSAQRDDIGELVRSVEGMRQRLVESMGAVRRSADSIHTASSEIATGNQDLSGRTEQTASSLQQAASSMEQLSATVQHTAESARTANQLAGTAVEAAQRGGTVVAQVVTNMDGITASSRRINDIIGTIDGIAFQTNILALNAAVEAARAGEQGRGFAVVASEVRVLAQRSAAAAREIKALIGDSVEKVEAGSRLVRDAGSTMQDIVASVQRVSGIIGEITSATTEQSEGLGAVNRSVTQLDQMTQQNAALVEQGAAAAESLREQAQRLAGAVQAFRLQEG
jgi:methyl-accepting chemotaxis protein